MKYSFMISPFKFLISLLTACCFTDSGNCNDTYFSTWFLCLVFIDCDFIFCYCYYKRFPDLHG